jgi:hypothetical protein
MRPRQSFDAQKETYNGLARAAAGVACAQSVYLYVAPGASVYVTPTPNGYYNGAPTVYQGPYPGPYAPPAPVVAAPLSPAFAAAEYATHRASGHELCPPFQSQSLGVEPHVNCGDRIEVSFRALSRELGRRGFSEC